MALKNIRNKNPNLNKRFKSKYLQVQEVSKNVTISYDSDSSLGHCHGYGDSDT